MADDAAGRVAAVLLAAGLSTRMGRPKPLLPWGGRSLIEYQVDELRAAGVDDVIVVTGHAADDVVATLRSAAVSTVYNAGYRSGRAGSVRAGAAALPDDTGSIVLLNVDQPRPAAITRTLLRAQRSTRALVCVPMHAGRRGHPVVLAGSLIPELRAVVDERQGLRAVLRAHAGETLEIEIDDPRVLLDLNTPDAYRAALTLFGINDDRGEEP